ncbi:YcnI family protein [Nocardia asteroides]|uniref:YcnI family copper-binding membrane protein n=1 Tax=Nocardia asteroides TaxID=1824 RepID=UPI001E46734C|nr:YcnI family protein [Nocardia asteroides]UGT59336.1 YcnI family protein [Nocardia asteroides]
MHSTLTRASVTTAAAACLILTAGGSAAAHVTVDAPGAAQGGYSVATFRVPTESDTASTTALTVTIPGVRSVRTEPLPGWTAKVDKNPAGEVTAVTWTADPGNAGVGPGQFQRFVVSIGPLPKEHEVSFPATQSYSDGSVVRWDQPAAADGSEPERPAPSVHLAEAAADGHSHGGSDTEAAAPDSTDQTARWLAGIGLAFGLFAVALGLGSVFRGRRP